MKNKYFKKIHKWNYTNLIILIIIIDLFSKYFVINHIKIDETKKIFSFLNFLNIHNYGIAFSLLSNQGEWKRWILSIISISTILVMIKIINKLKKKDKYKKISYSLIIAGATGNLINRMFYGFVIDFIDLHISDWHFSIFNIADISIFIGVLIFTTINYKKY